MIFGIKTRKDLKKEIEKLNKQLEEYRGSESIRKVTIVPITRPVVKVLTCCDIPKFLYDQYPTVANENIRISLGEGISKDLMKYMEIDVFEEPFGAAMRITGTLTVVVPEKGGICDDGNSKIDIS